MYPKYSEIEEALLQEIEIAGGQVRPKDIYDKVTRHFPQLTEEDLRRASAKYPSINLWKKRVQWARQHLVGKGQLDGSVQGVWRITDAGRRRSGLPKAATEREPEATLGDLIAAHEKRVRGRLLELVRTLSPPQFEHFAKRLLEAAGFSAVEVTGRSHDGGIDGHGRLRQGIVTVDAAFQCKWWEGWLRSMSSSPRLTA